MENEKEDLIATALAQTWLPKPCATDDAGYGRKIYLYDEAGIRDFGRRCVEAAVGEVKGEEPPLPRVYGNRLPYPVWIEADLLHYGRMCVANALAA